MSKYILILFLVLMACNRKTLIIDTKDADLFSKEKLIPWSIVAFDVKERNPAQRLAMIKRSGYTQYAFGGRKKHLATMEEEWNLAKKQGIKISAVWMYLLADFDQPGALRPITASILDALETTGLHTQIWIGFQPTYFQGMEDEEALAKAIKMVDYLARRADKLGCKIALYNHGGWFGEPENQLEIIRRLPEHELGIIYNFHHGHTHLDRIDTIFEKILPYLWCVNLNGMRSAGPKILPIGEGDKEAKMISLLMAGGYSGPFGILGHVKGGDPELILEYNYQGLQNLIWGSNNK